MSPFRPIDHCSGFDFADDVPLLESFTREGVHRKSQDEVRSPTVFVLRLVIPQA